ncbi:MAG: 50S ribosomal protein L22 [Candidatus Paceibacterota bacterium]
MAQKTKKLHTEVKPKTATAQVRYLRMAPRKVRLIGNVIKRMHVNEAEAQLITHARRAADPMLKVLRSAIDNAKKNGLDITKTIVQEIRTDKGPMLKRWMPRAQGRATPIHKHTSHIVVTLQEVEKMVQSRFVAARKEKKKPEHEHEHASAKKKTDKEKKDVETKTEVKTKDKGFSQKMFQRKSV